VRIAHVSDFYLPRQGGIELHVRDLAAGQHAAGHDVEVVTCSRIDRRDRHPVAEDGVRVHRVTEHAVPPWTYHPSGLAVGRRVIRRGRYDVVHAHMSLASPLSFAVAAAAAAAVVPLVVTVHSLADRAEPLFHALDAALHWSQWPAAFTAVSGVAAQPLRRLVGPDRPVHILPNGIDPSYWRVEPRERSADEVVVAAVMRLARRKRAVALVHMLREARRRLDPAIGLRAVIVGEGSQRAPLLRYLDRHAMADWVSLPGHWPRHEIRSLLGRADVFIAPATLETFGIAALEARCAGVPVVARRQGGISEFVTDGREGLLADSDAGMVTALLRLATDPAERAAIAAHNRLTTPSLAWTEALARTDEVYATAIGLARRARPGLRSAGSPGLYGVSSRPRPSEQSEG